MQTSALRHSTAGFQYTAQSSTPVTSAFATSLAGLATTSSGPKNITIDMSAYIQGSSGSKAPGPEASDTSHSNGMLNEEDSSPAGKKVYGVVYKKVDVFKISLPRRAQ